MTSNPVSSTDTTQHTTQLPTQHATQSTQPDAETEVGDVSPGVAVEVGLGDDAGARARRLRLVERFRREGRWESYIVPIRNRMMRECDARGLNKAQAQAWTYSELDRLYPPLPPESRSESDVATRSDSGRITGLGEIPAGWPQLPSNSSLAAEIGWCQANRLSVVEELPSGATRVHLDLASEPAPSRAALGWLETSIRSYAKYVDVAARVAATAQDEQENVRRERMALDEIDDLLRQMDEV